LKGVQEVAVVYRRTEKEMPADREELDAAVSDGVAFEYLLSPEAFLGTGVLQCRRMRLGSPDSSGRRRAEPTEEIRELPFDSVISAIGERADSGLLEGAGLKLGPEGRLKADLETLETEIRNVYVGGDAFRGPATVVESIADARRAADAILTKENLSLEHPAGSNAWAAHGLAAPLAEGWHAADFLGGWTCQIEQGHWGHPARKATWLYANGVDLPSLVWGQSAAMGRITCGHRQGKSMLRPGQFAVRKSERHLTPPAFAELLVAIARSAKVGAGGAQ